jgi:hypothetical protein
MPPGSEWPKKIAEKIDQAEWFLVLIGPNWVNERLSQPEDWVRQEIQQALGRPSLKVVPVLCGGARMPGREALPEEIRGLAEKQAWELPDAHFGEIARELADRIGPAIVENVAPALAEKRAKEGTEETPDRRQERNVAITAALITGAAALLAAAIQVVPQMMHPNSPQSPQPTVRDMSTTGDQSPNIVNNSGTISIGAGSEGKKSSPAEKDRKQEAGK